MTGAAPICELKSAVARESSPSSKAHPVIPDEDLIIVSGSDDMRFPSIPFDLSCASYETRTKSTVRRDGKNRETIRTPPAANTPNRPSSTSSATLTAVARSQIPTPDPAVESRGGENFGRCGRPVDIGDGSSMSVKGMLNVRRGKGRGEAEVVDDGLLRRLGRRGAEGQRKRREEDKQ